MPTQINTAACNKNQRGTGIPGCVLKLGAYNGFLLVTDPTWQLETDATESFNKEYIIEKVMDGTFVPFMGRLSFTDNTPDPTTQDYDGGITRTVRNGKPMYMFTYDNGKQWHEAASSYNSQSGLGVIFIDDAGTFDMASNLDKTLLMPYKLSDFNIQTYRPRVGDTNAATNITMQIANEVEYNERSVQISAETTGFDANTEINGIIDVSITGSGDISDGKITVKVVAKGQDTVNGWGARGLTATDFRVVNNANDTEVTITSVVPNPLVPGEYAINATLTGITSVTVSTYDAEFDVIVARVGTSTQLFRGINNAIAIAASVVGVFSMVFSNTFA